VPRVQLTGGAYQAHAIAAAAQRCLNLYSEPIPQPEGEPDATAHYPTPGLRLLATLSDYPVRGIRQATTGGIYVVAGSTVYSLDAVWNATALGSIKGGSTPVSMMDNGNDLLIVDGSSLGWDVTLATNAFAPIDDPTGFFAGADRVDFLDTFFLFNKPGTPQFYSSLSLSNTFDSLYFADIEAVPQQLVSLAVAKREIWLLGERATEVWYNTGSADFPFGAMPGAFVDHGCAAKYSVAVMDNAVYWLSRDRQGQGVVLRGAGYQSTRISTFAIEQEMAGYPQISDAVAYTYELSGHYCYVLSFPAADKTWVYDMTTQLWHEWAWTDAAGHDHRHRGQVGALCNSTFVVGDGQNGNLYALDPAVYTDNGAPIRRSRAWPHLEADERRVFYRQFIASLEVGMDTDMTEAPQAWLEWSDDRGVTWSNPVLQSMGRTGQYLTSVQFQRLGMARSRVFRLSWSAPIKTALLSAAIEATPALT
jgi:Phage stabilisation protein